MKLSFLVLAVLAATSAQAAETYQIVPKIAANRLEGEIVVQNALPHDLICRQIRVTVHMRDKAYAEPMGSPTLKFENVYIGARGQSSALISSQALLAQAGVSLIHNIAIESADCERPQFREFCRFASLSPDDTHTVAEILRREGATSCEDFREKERSRVSLRKAGLRSVRPVAYLPGLKHLNLARNKIENIEALGLLPNLETLDISENPVKSLDGLKGNLKLRELDASRTQIRDLAPLLALPALKHACFQDIMVAKADYEAHEKRYDELQQNCF